MFSLFCRSVGLMMATAFLAFAPVFPAQASAEEKAETCLATAAGRCSFTPGREGVHRIQLTLRPAQAGKLRDLIIGGQQCPLNRSQSDNPDGAVKVTCFAYLSGGMTYELSVPDSSQVSVVKADPSHGEPVTIIP
jgi:hypothetical protein